jgi:hypothetical protein
VSRRLCPSSCISDSASLSIWSSVPRSFIGSCALFVSQGLPIFVIWNNNVVLGIALFPYLAIAWNPEEDSEEMGNLKRMRIARD